MSDDYKDRAWKGTVKMTEEIARLTAELAAERERNEELARELDDYTAAHRDACEREDKLREALEAWQEWWELPWEAKRPDVAQLRYNKARATLAETGK